MIKYKRVNMRNKISGPFPIIEVMFILLLTFMVKLSSSSSQEKEAASLSNLGTYIVYVNKPEEGTTTMQTDEDLLDWHSSFLPVISTDENLKQRKPRMVYSYRHIPGFAARLTAEEVENMGKKDGVISVRPEKLFTMQTTHSPQFLGLNQEKGLWKDANFGKGVIIGVLDSGIYPNHPSFDDQEMPPPPAKWKGKCELNGTSCNNKIIGARSFQSGGRYLRVDSPHDEAGHGTHTASTAAGVFVKGAAVLGNANGTAVGMAPYAHLSIYRVCSVKIGCLESDVLAGFDAAIEDGVDVISISLSGDNGGYLYQDAIALGSFGAIQKGIFVSCSAGNGGPYNYTVANDAPWILTVGASTTDRTIRATAKLGNGHQVDGQSIFWPAKFSKPKSMSLPLVFPGLGDNRGFSSESCAPGTLRDIDALGKVVLCERGSGVRRAEQEDEVSSAGAAAMILMNQELDGFSTLAEARDLPVIHVSYLDGLKLKSYINSTSDPNATITFIGTSIGDSSAPTVASFSSRGPTSVNIGILKPDIVGPGVSILAAWPFTVDNKQNPKSTFNVLSGTSMSCPHLSGIAALLKSSHPDWSPAAIKSAIMTTANPLNRQGHAILDERLLPADVFAVGAGHVDPSKANDPGLVYDIKPNDYISYLCGLNYTDEHVGIFLQRKVNCTEEESITQAQFNYPSFFVPLGLGSENYTREVTNVGPADSSYRVKVVEPIGVGVVVKPEKLTFTEVDQKASYYVTFTRARNLTYQEFSQGSLEWVSDRHSVRSPISIKFM